MKKAPQLLGLVACERMEVDANQTGASLLGLIWNLRVSGFPSPPARFVVYAMVYGGSGEGIMRLTCRQLERERDVYHYTRWYRQNEPGHLSVLEIPVTRCVFPAPGRYALLLCFEVEGEKTRRYKEVGRTFFNVVSR